MIIDNSSDLDNAHYSVMSYCTMTVEKAIEMLQILRNSELFAVKSFSGNDSIQRNMKILSQAKADNLEKILHELEPETYSCNHPRECHDVCAG